MTATFLEGERIVLRPIEREDLGFIREEKTDSRVRRSLGWPYPENAAQIAEYFEETLSGEEGVHLLVVGDGAPAGTVSFHEVSDDGRTAELGYWIAPARQGEGYATAAVRLLLAYGFEQRGFHRVEARIFERNEASRAVVEKMGFTHEGRKREAEFIDGAYRDVGLYGLLAGEWRAG